VSQLRKLVVLALGIVGLVGAGCGAGPTAGPTPSASHPVVDVPLPDFNSRLGSNRLAAEAAARLGRRLFSQGQYWEVYLRTQPTTLKGKYDPAHPELSAPAAAQVTAAEVVIATESGAAVKAYSNQGRVKQQDELAGLEQDVRQAFPQVSTVTVRIFFGEAFQYAAAVFEHGQLSQYTVKGP
jgi:hypothetical protein